MSDIRTKLQERLRHHVRTIPEAPLSESAKLQDLGVDSITAVDLVLDLEQAFSIQFPDEMISLETFGTVGSLERAIQSLMSG